MEKRLKILTICNHGNIRSVALAYLIKSIYGHEAIAIGSEDTSKETWDMLLNWADKVIVMDSSVPIEAPLYKPRSDDKVIYLNIGKDIWFDAKHQALLHKLYKKLKELDL